MKKGDKVLVITGKDRGKTGLVERVSIEQGRLVVSGVNKIRKRVRKSANRPVGGTIEMFAPIDISNVMLVCPSCGKITRVSYRSEAGKKFRSCKKCQANLDATRTTKHSR